MIVLYRLGSRGYPVLRKTIVSIGNAADEMIHRPPSPSSGVWWLGRVTEPHPNLMSMSLLIASDLDSIDWQAPSEELIVGTYSQVYILCTHHQHCLLFWTTFI